jgi:hypothetical protein
MTGVDVTVDEELVEGSAVEGEALRLIEDRCLPRDAKPNEVFEDGFGEVWLRSLRVEIFDAEEEGAVAVAGTDEGLPEGSCVTQVEEARRGRCEASTIRRESHTMRTGYM